MSYGHCWVFQICEHFEFSTFTASSFRIWSCSAGIPSPPLALFVVMLPKAHMTSHSRMFGSRWVIILSSWLSGSLRVCFGSYSSSVYSCHLFLISSTSVRFIPFLSFIEPIFAWNVPLVSLIFLKSFPVSPFYCFPLFLCMDHWGGLYLISPCYSLELCIQMDISFIFSLPFISLLFSAMYKASSDHHFAFLHLFLSRMVLITTSYIMLRTSIYSSSGILSIISNPFNLFVTYTV